MKVKIFLSLHRKRTFLSENQFSQHYLKSYRLVFVFDWVSKTLKVVICALWAELSPFFVISKWLIRATFRIFFMLRRGLKLLIFVEIPLKHLECLTTWNRCWKIKISLFFVHILEKTNNAITLNNRAQKQKS